jgi:hypothetical protein
MTKKVLPIASLEVGKLRPHDINARFRAWRSRVDAWGGERHRAVELYSGGQWSVVRQVADNCKGATGPTLFVISAGYGLVKADAKIASYSATFGPNQPDSVSVQKGLATGPENRLWWRELSRWRPPGVVGPRSLRECFRLAPTALHLMAIAPSYLDAVATDLLAAREELRDGGTLVILSSGKDRHGDLNQSLVSAPATLQNVLGGALVSLNVRLAATILARFPPRRINPASARSFIAKLLATAKIPKKPQRSQVSDSQVRAFIRASRRGATSHSYTSLLSAFRDGGNACEMKRFKRIFLSSASSNG